MKPIDADDLTPGKRITYTVTSAWLITPQRSERTVRVVWVGDGSVYYRPVHFGNEEDARVHETGIERFLEIVNKPPLRNASWWSEEGSAPRPWFA